MNDEMRLARVDLGPGWIDLGYGEPVIVKEILRKYITLDNSKLDLLNAVYQPPKGNKDLIDLLEKKYKTDVVVTNGAKHGVAAVMYALKKLGYSDCAIPTPYWVSHKALITEAGLKFATLNDECSGRAVMITSPNNPDGKEGTKAQFKMLTKEAKKDGCILIHDAAYYTPIYMANPKETGPVGDVQIYSFSKMWGLSGIRIGYVVVHNKELLPYVIEYVEHSCSGVSTASQAVAFAVESHFRDFPKLRKDFEKECRKAIAASRKALMKIDPSVLKVLPCTSNSMFAWCEVGPKLDYKAAKVNMMPGEIFGGPSNMVRLNLAVNSDLISTAVDRLNEIGQNYDIQERSNVVCEADAGDPR